MIANLMMYARQELDQAHGRFWALIRGNLQQKGIHSPASLSQDAEEFFVWTHPELVLSQTCGMPYRIWLHDKVNLVGTPDYDLEGCPPGYYRSALVVRADDPGTTLRDFESARFAYNQTFSQSGYAAPYWHLSQQGFWFQHRIQSHGHLLSAKAVAEQRADIAAIDAMSWRLMQQYESFTAKLRILEWTEPTPGLPLITAKQNSTEQLFEAVSSAIVNLPNSDKQKLGIKGLVRIPKKDYLSIANPPGTDSMDMSSTNKH